ncbi:MAG: GNAT family N-acetyltransferase [Acidimicrobiia bacterium]
MKIVLPAGRPKFEATLPDGEIITLSPVLKSDREFFEKGLELLSIDSRFARFGQGVAKLTDRELDYLTDVNQRSHVAWGAALEGEVAGVGRYIVPDDGGCPELAITVLDEMQNRGVGRALLEALVSVARSDGLEELCFETQADNVAVRRLLGEIEIGPLMSEGTIERRVRLADLPPSRNERELLGVIEEVRSRH